jgi:pimeloyl-ACP methyl ester carboxylesterase
VALPARTTLLALAALAAVAFASVRITRAALKPAKVEQTQPEREATPAQAAATLAKLHAPPGFRQVTTCRFPEARFAQKCFWTPRTLVLDTQTLERVSATWPAQAGADPLFDPCSTMPHRNREGILWGHCNWELELGPELVIASADSVKVPAGHPTPKVAELLRSWRRGTEIRLTVIGHWPHDEAPASAPRL